MATSADTIAHICDTLAPLPLTHRRMFGEYALYLNEKVVAFVCDDTLFIKPTLSAIALASDCARGPAYPGSKDYIIADALLDDPDRCAALLRAVEGDSPAPKAKKPKKPKGD